VLAGGDTVDLTKQIDDVRVMPAGRAALLPGIGHFCAYEAPAAVARKITSHLADPPARPTVLAEPVRVQLLHGGSCRVSAENAPRWSAW
jgi:hypothetical protein